MHLTRHKTSNSEVLVIFFIIGYTNQDSSDSPEEGRLPDAKQGDVSCMATISPIY